MFFFRNISGNNLARKVALQNLFNPMILGELRGPVVSAVYSIETVLTKWGYTVRVIIIETINGKVGRGLFRFFLSKKAFAALI